MKFLARLDESENNVKLGSCFIIYGSPNFYLDLILAIGKKLTPNCGLLYTVRHPLSRDVLLIIFDMFHRQFG